MQEEVILSAKNIIKDYREGALVTNVLKGVNFDVRKNELTAIIGSSGSGKSTFLHILGTLDKPTSGEILFKGENLFALSSKKLSLFRNQNLGFVYQFHHLLADFTALENVCMPMLIAGKSINLAKKEALAILDRVGLSHRVNHKPSELSGGERQRVAIARAIINKPSVILADEPTGNLDRKSAEDIFKLLLDLRKETSCSLVVVTHDNELASRFTRSVRMHDGRFEE
ncbi:MAG: lipoprotein-releasing ABC transporter ATP-binding protein LolD [Succinivibrionaceae bacterium]|nr:lipoprotein-releasing ABC transporter ATP-binding protein LolD [Ruminobacter sp.]MEE1340446.1 lipoprotein-releasing ABC transporter ATP-binding protein LolD [Succinivibrionaceae bacterium]